MQSSCLPLREASSWWAEPTQTKPEIPRNLPDILGLSEAYSWLRYVPERLRRRILPTLQVGEFNPGPILIMLYAGKNDPLSLDSLNACSLSSTFPARSGI